MKNKIEFNAVQFISECLYEYSLRNAKPLKVCVEEFRRFGFFDLLWQGYLNLVSLGVSAVVTLLENKKKAGN